MTDLSYDSDRVQDMLPLNMAPWQIKYFKMKECEKSQALKDLRISDGVPLPTLWGKEYPYLQRRRDSKKIQTNRPWLNVPHLLSLAFYDFLLLIKHSVKTLRFNHFFTLQRLPYRIKRILNKCVYFSVVNHLLLWGPYREFE